MFEYGAIGKHQQSSTLPFGLKWGQSGWGITCVIDDLHWTCYTEHRGGKTYPWHPCQKQGDAARWSCFCWIFFFFFKRYYSHTSWMRDVPKSSPISKKILSKLFSFF